MQDQDGRVDPSGKTAGIASRVEDDSLRIPGSEDVAQDRSTTTRVSKQPNSIGACAWQRACRLNKYVQRLHGLLARRTRHGWRFWTVDRGDEAGAASSAAPKPARRQGKHSTTREIFGQAYILMRKAVTAVQKNNSRERTHPARTRNSHWHDAQPRTRHSHPLHREDIRAGWGISNRHLWLRAGPALRRLCRSLPGRRSQRDQHAAESSPCDEGPIYNAAPGPLVAHPSRSNHPRAEWNRLLSSKSCKAFGTSYGCSVSCSGSHSLRGAPKKSPP